MDTSPEPKKLPSKPSLEHLQKQAKKLVKQDSSLQLTAAQHRIAQEYGFKNWAELAKAVEAMAGSSPSGLAETSKSGLPELPMDAASYIGRYPLGIGGHPSGSTPSIEITEYKGRLRAQGPGLPPGPMRAIGPDRFALGGSTQEISFERDATGKVVALKWSRHCLRQPLPQPPASVELPAGDLLEYSGRYAVTPTFIIGVEVDRNELFVQIGNRSKLRAFALAKDEFFVTSMNAKIHFRRDEAGQVSGIVVAQKSHNLAGTKCDK